MKRVEVLVAHVFQSKRREIGEQYDINDRDEPEVYRTVVEAYKWARPVDGYVTREMKAEEMPEIAGFGYAQEAEAPIKRKRGRPKGSGIGHYNRRDLRAEE